MSFINRISKKKIIMLIQKEKRYFLSKKTTIKIITPMYVQPPPL